MNLEQLQLLKKLHAISSEIDIRAFMLRNPLKLPPDRLIWAANQLHFREKIAVKIPIWSKAKTLVSPASLSIEQSSSEITAAYKASLIPGATCLDLTGGMGVDSFFFSKVFETVTYVEQNVELCEIARHNFNELEAENIEVINQTAEDFLASNGENFDLIYVDPARRNEQGGKVFFIQDCTPNIADLLPELLKITDTILVKYAPMLDIKSALKTLGCVEKVIIVAIENDVKEALYLLKKTDSETSIETVNFTKGEKQKFTSSFELELRAGINLQDPQSYLYEPNAAILKAGLFKSVAEKFNLIKIAVNSHLYSSEAFISDFPGRKFSVEKVIKFDKKILKKELKGNYANISCRNFPLKPEALKKLLGYIDGGEKYLFFTQNERNEKLVIFTVKAD
ncbi:MAG: class I SAM-dependent methyltransferase [Spirosomaceae bacterium]|nr:class I SAM-dependent methyltransferase [Spirosomataceae bacterium]